MLGTKELEQLTGLLIINKTIIAHLDRYKLDIGTGTGITLSYKIDRKALGIYGLPLTT